jgi:hypothetical protein
MVDIPRESRGNCQEEHAVTAGPEYTVLGLPLDSRDEDYDLVQPLEALVVVRGLDSADQVHHWAIKTPDLTNVDAMGMAMFGYEVAKKSACG